MNLLWSPAAAEVMGKWKSEEALDLEEDEAGIADIEQSAAQKQKEWTERRR
jgi:hypothetical protein